MSFDPRPRTEKQQEAAIDDAFNAKFKATAKRQKRDFLTRRLTERQKKFRAYY